MLFDHLLEPGDRVVVEQPTYDRTLLLLQRAGVELVPVPLESDGLEIAALEAAFAEGPIKFAHVIPNFHNPAGCTLSAGKRVRLVELAAEHGFWIFEDDPYRELPFEGEALETMLSIDRRRARLPCLVLLQDRQPGSAGRLLVGPAGRSPSSPSGQTRPTSRRTCWPRPWSWSSAAPASSIATSTSSKARCATAATPSSRRCGSRSPRPSSSSGGGYFLWADLAEGTDTTALLAEAKGEGVAFVAGPDFMIDGGGNSLRFSFASVPPERIAEGVSRVARALERIRAASPA